MQDKKVEVKYAIVHNLKKETAGKAALEISNALLNPADEKTISLITELNARFRKNITYGLFSEDHGGQGTFQDAFTKYRKQESQSSFISMTTTTVNMLFNRVDSIPQAKGGYVVFAEYTDFLNHQFHSVFLIRDKEGRHFCSENGAIKLEGVIHVDTEKLAMACRINTDLFEARNGSYLGFVSIRQPETSDYFLNWIGAEKKKTSENDSRILVKILSNIELPENDEGELVTREELKAKAFTLIKGFGKEEVNINTISSALFDDENKIAAYAEDNSYFINTVFRPDQNSIRRLVSALVRGDRMELKYPPEYYGKKITIDKKNPNLVLIDSVNLADAIRQEEKN